MRMNEGRRPTAPSGRTGAVLPSRDRSSPSVPVLAALGLAAALAAGCGGGGGPAPKPADSANLYVKSFSAPNYAGIYFDEDLQLNLSAPVNEDSINPDSFRMRTGTQGGTAPYGVYVRGVFMVDPATGNRVVIDPDGTTTNVINRVEKTGDLSRIPDSIRIDLGNDEPPASNGGRQPLFDRSQRNIVTFVPEIPTRAALDDTGLIGGATYQVVIPGYPSTNTLENVAGAQLLSPNNRIFTSSFRVVSTTAPKLFLGAETAGLPRVIHSSPYNGTTNVPVTETIAIRFNQPLDPRTVTIDKFKVELISVAPPYPQIPVSVFLAQQRLGKVEVILTPINPMPANGTIRVTLSTGIEDLLGQALNQTVISFLTGTGPVFIPDFLESFNDTLSIDAAATTAVWNSDKPYVGATAGQLTAAFAPYAGDGLDGAFAAPIGAQTVISTGSASQRVYNFTTFSIPIGARVVATGNFPLVIHCQGTVDISGELHLDASNGGNGFRGDAGNVTATGGAGGAGGAGGNAGGDGAMKTIGAGGNFDGLDGLGLTTGSGGVGGNTGENDGGNAQTMNSPSGALAPFWPRLTYSGGPVQTTCVNPPKSFEPCRQREGGGGAGGSAIGGNADNFSATQIRRGASPAANGGTGGGTWGSATMSGASTSATVSVLDPNNLPSGLRTITLNGIPTLTAGMGGAGGGGGGGEDDSQDDNVHWGVPDGTDEGGGGGGGGGGALQIVSYTTINFAGTVTCKGGNGGSTYDDVTLTQFSQGAGGGGGSGGVIWAQARGTISVQGGAVMDVSGGLGGQGYADGTTTVYNGGAGSLGRIRLEDADGNIVNSPGAASVGVFTPALDLDSVGQSSWQDTGIFTPDFGAPTVDADVFPALPFNGTIKIYMEAAPENVLTVPSDPDTANSTGFIKVWDSTLGGLVAGNPWDLFDNNKWWRFRVDFHVDGFHTFTDPMPTVREILFDIKQ